MPRKKETRNISCFNCGELNHKQAWCPYLKTELSSSDMENEKKPLNALAKEFKPNKNKTGACAINYTDNTIDNQNLKVYPGYIEKQKVNTLRDTGCSTVVVRKVLVPKEKLTGEIKTITTISKNVQIQAEVAYVEIDTPFFTGTVEALCIDNPIEDLVIVNIENVNTKPDFNWKPANEPLDSIINYRTGTDINVTSDEDDVFVDASETLFMDKTSPNSGLQFGKSLTLDQENSINKIVINFLDNIENNSVKTETVLGKEDKEEDMNLQSLFSAPHNESEAEAKMEDPKNTHNISESKFFAKIPLLNKNRYKTNETNIGTFQRASQSPGNTESDINFEPFSNKKNKQDNDIDLQAQKQNIVDKVCGAMICRDGLLLHSLTWKDFIKLITDVFEYLLVANLQIDIENCIIF